MVFCAFSAIAPVSEGAETPAEVNDGTLTSLTNTLNSNSVVKITTIAITVDSGETLTIPTNKTVIIDVNNGITLNGGTIEGESGSKITTTCKNGTNTVAVFASGEATIKGVIFEMSAASDGSMPIAILGEYTSESSKTVSGCTFTSGTEGKTFGAIYAQNSPVNVENCEINGNVVTFKQDTNLTLSNSGSIILNIVEGSAGQQFNINSTNLDVTNTTIIKTILGYEPSTVPATVTKNDIESIKDLEIEVSDVDLGEVCNSKLYSEFNVSTESEITIGGKVTAYGMEGINLVINNLAELEVPTGKTLTVSKTVGGTGTIVGDGKVAFENGAGTGSVTIDPSIDVTVDSSAMDTQYVGGTAFDDNEYGEKQIIEVIAGQDWTISSGVDIIINGQFIVPEGSTITIQEGATLTINGIVASEIDGKVVIEAGVTEGTDDGKLVIGSKVNFNADVSIDGDLEVAAGGNAKFNANVTVTETGSIITGPNLAEIEVSEVSVMTIYGSMDVADVSNYGAIVIDSEVASSASTISLLKSGAYVDVVNFTVDAVTGGTLTINDEGLIIKNITEASGYENVNEIEIDPSVKDGGYNAVENDVITVSGLKVTESAVAKNVEGSTNQKYIDNQMDISGELKTSAYTEETLGSDEFFITLADVTIHEDSIITITDELIIGANVTVNNGGKMTVTGKVTANIAPSNTSNDSGSTFTTGDGEAQLILKDSGLVQIFGTAPLDNGDDIEATLYETSVTSGSTTTKYQNYVTIDTALDNANADSGITRINVLQNQTVLKDNTVPAGVTMTISYGLAVGDEKDNTDVTLTISKDAKKINTDGNKITVNGTLYAEDKSKVTKTDVISHVMSEELNDKGVPTRGGWAKFTNLYTAMTEANAGETITVSTTALDVKKNLTVKDGVTLAIPAGVTAKIYEGVTVTVNGYIVTDSEISTGNTKSTVTTPVVTVFGKTASTVENKAAIVLGPNGYIASSVQDISFIAVETAAEGSQSFAKLPVAGAFYDAEIDDAQYNVLSSLEVALGMKDKITGTITLNGKVTAGDVSFAAADEDTCKSITLEANADVVFQSLTLDGTSLIATNGDFSGPVTVAGVTVSFAHVNGFTVEDADDVMTFESTGEFTSAADTDAGEKASVTLTAGTMKATIGSTGDDAVKFIVGAGATLEATEDLVTFKELVIDGTVSVPSKAQLTGNTTTINENGVLSVAPLTATEDKGTFTVTTLNVGIVGKDYFETAAAASVSGPITFANEGTAYVAAGIDVTKDTFTNNDVKSTALYIGDELWMTVYTVNASMTFDDVDLDGDKSPIENGKFLDWVDEDGESLTSTTSTSDDAKSIGYVDKAIAKVDYNVYNVVIMANAGVENVSVDGNLLPFVGGSILGMDISAGYHASGLTAGKHTITYTLANGYSGTATLAVNGSVPEGVVCALSGLDFNISGDFGNDKTVILQLTGIEKSGFVPDSPDAPSDSGMTITDYLLIILVVLIVVMAIIVAMRLMRS